MERPKFSIYEPHTRDEVDDFADLLRDSEFMGQKPEDFELVPRVTFRDRLVSNLQENLNKAKPFIYGGLATGTWMFVFGSINTNRLDLTDFLIGIPPGILFVWAFKK